MCSCCRTFTRPPPDSCAPSLATRQPGITAGRHSFCQRHLDFAWRQEIPTRFTSREGRWTLSLIAPEEWGHRVPGAFVAQCQLRHDMTWALTFDEAVREGSPVHDALLQYLDGIHEQLRESGSWEALLRQGERQLPYQQRVLTTALASSLRQSLTLSGQAGVPLSVPILRDTLALSSLPR